MLREMESSDNCYDPIVVAIGPYHHDLKNNKVKRMEDFKIQFREQYARKCEKPWNELYEEMKTFLVKAKNYYIAEDVEKNFKDDDEFANMMFLDSCFVIEFMDNCVNSNEDDERIELSDSPFIMRDIMLLENQLPFNILEKLMSFNRQYEGKEMIDKFINMIIHDRTGKSKGTNKAKENSVLHLLESEKSEGTSKAKENSVLHLLEFVQTRLIDGQKISRMDDQKISRRDLEHEGPTKETQRWKTCSWLHCRRDLEHEGPTKETQRWKTCSWLYCRRDLEHEGPTKETQRWKTCSWLHLPSSNKEIKKEYVKITIVDDSGMVEEIEYPKKEVQRWKTCFGFHLPSFHKEIKNKSSIKSSPMEWKYRWKYRSVQELKSMGIHFWPSKTRQFSDITFISRHLYGWLMLPPITIQKGTKSLLLNLVAFDACADPSSNFGVSSYVAFMDTLIDHAEDVKELRSKGIIYNLLSNDEQVAKLFNEMGESVVVVDYRIWASVQDSLNAFYNSRCSLWFTECLNKHCGSPWAVIGIVAAIVVVCLTISQTVFSAIQL